MKLLRRPDAMVLALLLALAAGLGWKGWLQGKLYLDEDVLGFFFTARSRLYALAHGHEPWSWWDPLVQLGMPRLSDPQLSYFAPGSLLFYLLPPARAWAVYPTLAFFALFSLTYFCMRSLRLQAVPALVGTLSWCFVSIQLYSVQQPPVIETICWLPFCLGCWERHRRLARSRSVWLFALTLGLIGELLAGSPVHAFANLGFLGLWIVASAGSLPRFAEAFGALALAGAVSAFQWIGMAEISHLSSRTLVEEGFSQFYQQTPLELAAYLCREVHFFVRLPNLRYSPLYPQQPGFSGVALALAAAALIARRRLPEHRLTLLIAAALALLFALGSLGTGGGVLPLLLWLLPPLKVLRGSFRLISPATLALSYLAGAGSQAALRAPLRSLPVVWLLVGAGGLDYPYIATRWASSEAYHLPPNALTADSRFYLDMHVKELPSPLLLNLPMAAGKACLELQDPLVLRRTFEGIFYSQLPSSVWDHLHSVIDNANLVPFNYPDAPLIRAFGLRTVLRVEGAFALPHPMPEAWVASTLVELKDDAQRHERAAARDWDPSVVALVEGNVSLAGAVAGPARTLESSADRKVFQASGPGLLVDSAAYYPGWVCTVDGRPAPILPADIALRGVVLEAGAHRIELRYAPSWLKPSLCLSALAFLVLAGYGAVATRRIAGSKA